MRQIVSFIFLLFIYNVCESDTTSTHRVLKSEDGLVCITAWETPLAGMSGSYNTELEFNWEGKIHVVRRLDEDSDETVMMPMRLHSIGDNLYLLYQLYRESSWQVYLEMGAYKLTKDGLLPTDIFDTPDGWSSCLSSEITTTSWNYELNEDSGDYWWTYYYDAKNTTIYHPVTENGAITGTFIPYVWNGMSFAPGEKLVTAEELSNTMNL